MTSTVMSRASTEPSPPSGEKPKCRSIKSIGKHCCDVPNAAPLHKPR
jgi:hypothetical protein